MKYLGYKVLLTLLRGLMYVKRGLFWLGRIIFRFGKYLQGMFENTIGFRLYKVNFFLKKKLNSSTHSWSIRLLEFAGSRSTLQVILLFIFAIIMYPHSSLYTEDALGLPGRKTVLYSLIGPGDEFYDELLDVEGESVLINNSATWRQGAIGLDDTTGPVIPQETEISGLGPGGAALINPNILPGVTLPKNDNTNNNAQPKRRGMVDYVVQSGDVIGSIATKFSVDVNSILWANNLTFRSYIRPGDVLKIPPGSGLMHTVKKGETLGKIANLYKVKTEDIVKANALQKDGSDLALGETLFVPGAEKIATPTPVPARTLVRETQKATGINKVAAPPPSIEVPAGSGYIWPSGARRITQYYGLRHTGLDIAGPVGLPNYAVKAGKVIKSQCGWNGGYGCYIIIDHGGGITSLYGHNSKLLVSVGEYVKQGQTIGLVGNTGRSTGPHIHFEIRINGVRTNPLKYVR